MTNLWYEERVMMEGYICEAVHKGLGLMAGRIKARIEFRPKTPRTYIEKNILGEGECFVVGGKVVAVVLRNYFGTDAVQAIDESLEPPEIAPRCEVQLREGVVGDEPPNEPQQRPADCARVGDESPRQSQQGPADCALGSDESSCEPADCALGSEESPREPQQGIAPANSARVGDESPCEPQQGPADCAHEPQQGIAPADRARVGDEPPREGAPLTRLVSVGPQAPDTPMYGDTESPSTLTYGTIWEPRGDVQGAGTRREPTREAQDSSRPVCGNVREHELSGFKVPEFSRPAKTTPEAERNEEHFDSLLANDFGLVDGRIQAPTRVSGDLAAASDFINKIQQSGLEYADHLVKINQQLHTSLLQEGQRQRRRIEHHATVDAVNSSNQQPSPPGSSTTQGHGPAVWYQVASAIIYLAEAVTNGGFQI